MPQDDDARESWAKRTAHQLVDGALAASERSAASHPSPDQVALLREIVRRALWHMPNSEDELKSLRDFTENLHKPGADEPPWP